MLKKSLVLLTVLSFAVVANAGLPVGSNIITQGDMENGGDATTPPLYWSNVGTDPGQGTVGVSSDIRPGSAGVQSLIVTGYNSNYGTYSHAYSDQSGYLAGTQIEVSMWIKGHVYTSIGAQGGGSITRISGDGTQWLQTEDWTYIEGLYEVTADANGFSYYCYANSPADAYMDDLRMIVVPEPATMTLIGLGGLALIRRRRK